MPTGASSSHNRPTGAVHGGTSATPTPANNVGGGTGWGDAGFKKGGTASDTSDNNEPREGYGHVDPPNPRATMGEALGLQQQKTRAKYNYLKRSDDAANVKPMSEHGEPTCASEDHSFMNHPPEGAHTLPGWGTVRNVMGAMGGHSS